MFAVRTTRGPAWDDGRGVREQLGWTAHVAMEVPSASAVADTFAQEPWLGSGVITVGPVRQWLIWLKAQ